MTKPNGKVLAVNRVVTLVLVGLLAACTAPGTSQSQPEGSAAQSSAAAGEWDPVAIAAQLVPPSSALAEGGIEAGGGLAHYSSTASIEDLQAFFEEAIPDAGFEIVDAAETDGTYRMPFEMADGTKVGEVQLVPLPSPPGGVEVVIQMERPS